MRKVKSNVIFVNAFLTVVVEDILQGQVVHVFVDDFVQPDPDIQWDAGVAVGTVGNIVDTGNRGEAALGDAQDVAQSVLAGLTRQLITLPVGAT